MTKKPTNLTKYNYLHLGTMLLPGTRCPVWQVTCAIACVFAPKTAKLHQNALTHSHGEVKLLNNLCNEKKPIWNIKCKISVKFFFIEIWQRPPYKFLSYDCFFSRANIIWALLKHAFLFIADRKPSSTTLFYSFKYTHTPCTTHANGIFQSQASFFLVHTQHLHILRLVCRNGNH